MVVKSLCAVVVLSASQIIHAQAPRFSCAVPPTPAGYDLFLIDAATMTRSASTPLQYKNDEKLFIVVQHINPFNDHYTINIKRTPIVESAATSFLPLVGGVASQFIAKPETSPGKVTLPGVDPTLMFHMNPPSKRPTPPQPSCNASFDHIADDLEPAFANLDALINNRLKAATQEYSSLTTAYTAHLQSLKSTSECADILSKAVVLDTLLARAKAPDTYAPVIPDKTATLVLVTPPAQPTFAADISSLSELANTLKQKTLAYRVQASAPECAANLAAHQDDLARIDLRLSRLLDASSGAPDIELYRNTSGQLSSQYTKLVSAKESLDATLNQTSNPFFLTQETTDNQADVEISVTSDSSEPSTSGSAAAQTNASAVKTDEPTSKKPTKAPTSGKSFDTTVHFGYGARLSISGGIVVSTLQKEEFTTANGEIAYQNHSDTRILPIALLSARLSDCDPKTPHCLFRPYLSFGVTAKSDDKGTLPEYIIGPSWGLVNRQLFLTAGAYAGTQQRLLGGLVEGQATTLSAANLPIAKEYHWNAGFAISWKLK